MGKVVSQVAGVLSVVASIAARIPGPHTPFATPPSRNIIAEVRHELG